MRTELDSANSWFLHAVVYQDELNVILVEGITGNEAEELHVGNHVIIDLRSIDVTDDSRMFRVRFAKAVAWHVVDESYTAFDAYEQRDDTCYLQTLTRSKYLDYVNDNHGWYEQTLGKAVHYRIWTENDVIDVVATEPPIVEPMDRSI